MYNSLGHDLNGMLFGIFAFKLRFAIEKLLVIKEEPLLITEVIQTYDYVIFITEMGSAFCFG